MIRAMATSRGRRTQGERRNRSEEALLDAAAELIADRGIERASLASIGHRAGTSRGLPTHHFGSKDALVTRLAHRTQDRIQERIRLQMTPGSDRRDTDDVPALELICLTTDTFLELFEAPTADERALIAMWGATFPSEASLEGMVEADRRSHDGWAGLVARGQREGSVRPDIDPSSAAVVLTGILRGVAAMLLRTPPGAGDREVRRLCTELITAALAVPALTDGGRA